MSSSSVVVLKRNEVEPAYEWYVDLDRYLEPQSNAPGADNRIPRHCGIEPGASRSIGSSSDCRAYRFDRSDRR